MTFHCYQPPSPSFFHLELFLCTKHFSKVAKIILKCLESSNFCSREIYFPLQCSYINKQCSYIYKHFYIWTHESDFRKIFCSLLWYFFYRIHGGKVKPDSYHKSPSQNHNALYKSTTTQLVLKKILAYGQKIKAMVRRMIRRMKQR